MTPLNAQAATSHSDIRAQIAALLANAYLRLLRRGSVPLDDRYQTEHSCEPGIPRENTEDA